MLINFLKTLHVKVISRTGSILGLFVLILMQSSCWIQKYTCSKENLNFEKSWKTEKKNLCINNQWYVQIDVWASVNLTRQAHHLIWFIIGPKGKRTGFWSLFFASNQTKVAKAMYTEHHIYNTFWGLLGLKDSSKNLVNLSFFIHFLLPVDTQLSL